MLGKRYIKWIISLGSWVWEVIIMALTQKEMLLLTPPADRYQRGCGDGLILVVEPVHKGGEKSFLGRFRKQVNGATKQIPVWIGVFGSKTGQFALKQARERRFEIREWAKMRGSSRDAQRQQQLSRHGALSTSPLLFSGCNSFSSPRFRWSSHPTTNCG